MEVTACPIIHKCGLDTVPSIVKTARQSAAGPGGTCHFRPLTSWDLQLLCQLTIHIQSTVTHYITWGVASLPDATGYITLSLCLLEISRATVRQVLVILHVRAGEGHVLMLLLDAVWYGSFFFSPVFFFSLFLASLSELFGSMQN